MKNIKILAVVLLALGLASAGIGCGSSSGGSSGSQVSSGVNSLPPANLTVQSVSGAAGQAIGSVNNPPPNSVTTATSTTVSGSQSPTIPTLSFLFQNISTKNSTIMVKPQSMNSTALNTLSVLKQAVTSGACFTNVSVSDNSTPGNIDVTVTWNNVSCTSSSVTLTLNGSITVTGSYDNSLGTFDVVENENLTFTSNDSSTSSTTTMNLNGKETITGAGIVAGATSITYSEVGHTNISATVTSPTQNGSFSGWIDVDDTFTGTPSQLIFTINDGTEIDIGSTKIVGTYGIATITMTTFGGAPITAMTVNGSGTYGVAVSPSTYGYSGRISVVYSNLLFSYGTCSGASGGTVTITGAANNVFVFDFDGQSCGCAAVTENGTPVPNSPYCGY